MKVIWSERAAFAVKNTALYIEKEFDKKAKQVFLSKIDKFDILLHTNPYMGKEEPLLKKLPENIVVLLLTISTKQFTVYFPMVIL